ncbi:hypothetical protein TDB9533_01696 [Thalassocella blandensis]|nr:hypothetical protein TDB9533_01696 [Thalassocella blandensis]
MISFLRDSIVPISVSLALHGLLFGALFVSWESEKKPVKRETPKFVEAKLVKLKEQTTKKAAAKQPKKIDLAAKRREQERLKKEAEQKRQAQIKREREAKAKREEEKRQQEQEKKRLAQEQELEKQRKNKQRLQQEFEEALKAEEGMLMEEIYATEAQSYISKIQQRVEQNWNQPPSARTGMRCTLRIQLVPTGRVVSADVIESSGNAAFDRSAVQAVKKVEVFPEIKEMSPEVFERNFRKFKFIFNPQDLRL